jgi:D-3-phosphoglycerate dehydrogenase / 2-oxoglutarate reductase
MKIYVLDPIYDSGLAMLEEQAEVVRWDDARAAQWPEDADGLIVRQAPVSRADLERAKGLKAIGKQGVGVENIDLEAARDCGITVFNTAGSNAEAVSEMAMALALSVARRVTQTDRLLRAGETVVRQKFHGRGFAGKTLGVIGLGHIGRKVAEKWHRAFNMTALGYDPFLPDDAWPATGCRRMDSLSDLLPAVDLLSIHAPLTDHTRGLIDTAALALMKPTAILVSAARGGIVDEGALYEAIASERLYGAGLDVFEKEPPAPDHPLLTLPTVVSTPHIGGGTIETQSLSAETVARGLLSALKGDLPPTVIV